MNKGNQRKVVNLAKVILNDNKPFLGFNYLEHTCYNC